jgi:hypothetical protein
MLPRAAGSDDLASVVFSLFHALFARVERIAGVGAHGCCAQEAMTLEWVNLDEKSGPKKAVAHGLPGTN